MNKIKEVLLGYQDFNRFFSVLSELTLCVCIGTRQLITRANLGAKTNEDGNEINFLLVRAPRFGRLLVANKNQFEETNMFSQSQVTSTLSQLIFVRDIY